MDSLPTARSHDVSRGDPQLMRKSAGRVSTRSFGRSPNNPGHGLATRPAPAVSLLLWRQTEKERTILKNKMATLLVIVSAMLIGAGMTWQQRLLFVGGIVFGLVVEALPDLVDRLKEALTERWRLSQVVKRSKVA